MILARRRRGSYSMADSQASGQIASGLSDAPGGGLGSAGISLINSDSCRACIARFVREAGPAAQARAPYDGLWSVSLKVDQGSCGQHEIEMFIRNGEISHAGDSGFFTAEGRAGDRGRLEVSIGALGMTASADGQLSDRQGSGTWVFPERGCSGRWLAERRSP